MPPRLSHKKSRAGCRRCKARKVKCDEARPVCAACRRHGVPCEYAGDSPSASPETPIPIPGGNVKRSKSHQLELRLMYEWEAYVCEATFSAWQFWKYEAPSVAIEHDHLLDAMLAMAALWISRQKPRRWDPLEGHMVSLQDQCATTMSLPNHDQSPQPRWLLANDSDSNPPLAQKVDPVALARARFEMLQTSRRYFDRSLEGQQRAIAELGSTNIKAAHACSNLVATYAMFTLGQESQGEEYAPLDLTQWFRLARGQLVIVLKWIQLIGKAWRTEAGGLYGQPDLSNHEELFRPEHQEPFRYLLNDVRGEVIASEDREAYNQTLSYIGLMYKGIRDSLDTPHATCRRVLGMPGVMGQRFTELLLDEHQPRALVMMIHVMACVKLTAAKYEWFRGIAEHQIPVLCQSLPEPWLEMVRWPLRVLREDGIVDPAETMREHAANAIDTARFDS